MGYYYLPQQKVGYDLDEPWQDTTEYPVLRVSQVSLTQNVN